jgi:hypothetical protein
LRESPVPLPTHIGCEKVRVCGADKIGDAEILRVVRNHQEIQRPIQLRTLAGAGADLLAAGEPEGIRWADRVSDHAAVDGKRGVVVGIAEEHLLGEVLIHVGGIGFRLFDQLILLRRRVPFAPQRRASRQKRDGDYS